MMTADWFTQFREKQQLPQSYYDNFKTVAEVVSKRVAQCSPPPYFIALNGCQGSGKSTLVAFLKEYLWAELGKKTVVASLDDFYYSAHHRQQLAKTIHPLLSTRGVPGTHDTHLLADVFTALKNKQPVDIPVFDKAIDTLLPRSLWQQINTPPDVFIFEGWCWGVESQTNSTLEKPINKLEETKDKDGHWRQYVNQQLRDEYEKLYSLFDYWIYLRAPSFENVLAWRTEQEHKLKQKYGSDTKLNEGIMSDNEIETFISYFQRLTEEGFKQMPSVANLRIELDKKRQVKEILI